ncbi:MAG: hypothetical protein H0V17_09350, partial [Deltaproteobacteria bacterium]|nr:hypothetical protein [Deltaproteobacteria bacterium]
AKLTVSLAPLGVADTTVGKVSGGGTATRVNVPASALAPSNSSPAGDPKPGTRPRADTPPPPRPVIVAPQRPSRNCSGENRTCRDGCYSADSSCRFSCPGCTSCLTSVGWDECKRQCDTCRHGCEQNNKFCESSCSTQQSNCQASQ